MERIQEQSRKWEIEQLEARGINAEEFYAQPNIHKPERL
jgi:hypothetical protein